MCQQAPALKDYKPQLHSCVQGAEKQPAQNNTSVMIHHVQVRKQIKNSITSPGISIGNAANESMTSETETATVFLSTTASPMLVEW